MRFSIDEALRNIPKMDVPHSTLAKVDNVLAGLENRKTDKNKMKLKLLLPIAAVIILCVVLCGVALAAAGVIDFGRFYNSLFNNPDAEGKIEIAQTSESNGLEITLLSAFVDGYTAYYNIEIRDIEGTRISDSISVLNESYTAGIHNISTGSVIYDDVEKKATLVLTVSYNYNIAELGTASLSIDTIMSGIKIIEDGVLEFDIASHATDNETVSLEEWHALYGGGGGWSMGAGREATDRVSVEFVDGDMVANGEWAADGQLELRPLIPGDLEAPIGGIDWAVVSNVGISDGLLHILIKNIGEDELNFVTSSFCVVDSKGDVTDWLFAVISMDSMYKDIMFDIGADAELEDLTDLRLALRGTEFTGRQVYDNVIHGEWNISFAVEQAMQERTLTAYPEDNPFFAKLDVTCSPVRVAIQITAPGVVVDEYNMVAKPVDGYDDKTDVEKIDIQHAFISGIMGYYQSFDNPILTLDDGSMIILERPECMFDDYGGSVWCSIDYFNIENLHSITFCGEEYLFDGNA